MAADRESTFFRLDIRSLPTLIVLVSQIVGGTYWVSTTSNRLGTLEQAQAQTYKDLYRLRIDIGQMQQAVAAINGKLDTRQRNGTPGGYGTSSAP